MLEVWCTSEVSTLRSHVLGRGMLYRGEVTRTLVESHVQMIGTISLCQLRILHSFTQLLKQISIVCYKQRAGKTRHLRGLDNFLYLKSR